MSPDDAPGDQAADEAAGQPADEPADQPADEPAEKPAPWYAPTTRRGVLIEALLVFGAATLVCAILWPLHLVSGFVHKYLQTFIAAIFLYVPTFLLLKRKESFSRYGLTTKPVGRGLAFFLVPAAVVFPLFAVGFYCYYQRVCALATVTAAAATTTTGAPLARRFYSSLCTRWVGHYSRARLRLRPDFWQMVLSQLLVVALPEEYFFRGYLQTRLEEVWPARRRLLGGQIGLALVVASVLFALGHLLVGFNVLRLAVFFPGLVFGWMRSASGSILAGVLFHACSNVVSELLHSSFF